MHVEAIAEDQRQWRLAASAGGSEAERAARRSLEAMGEALSVLAGKLVVMGYPAVPGRQAPTPLVAQRIRRIESFLGGTIPPIVSLFWRVVGGVSLVDLQDYRHVEFWSARGIAAHRRCDGVHIEACTDAWADALCDAFTDWAMDEPSLPAARASFVLSLAPDGEHKDNLRGGAYGVRLGSSWLPLWEDFSWRGAERPRSAPAGSCDFLGYLRSAILECAGFPGLLGVPQFEPIRRSLLRDLPRF